MRDKVKRKYYCQIFDQAFSSCGRYCACCDSYGVVSVFDLDDCFSSSKAQANNNKSSSASATNDRDTSDQEQCQYPAFRLKIDGDGGGDVCDALRQPVYALASNERHLICGGADGTVTAYDWSDLEADESEARPAFHLTAAPSTITKSMEESGVDGEINSLLLIENGERLISAGASDNNRLKLWDLEHRTVIRSFSGHTDYVHCVARGKTENELVSAGEDGAVILWDVRTAMAVSRMVPSDSSACARKELGDWIGCCAVDGDWLICGGGPSLALWHLSSQCLGTVIKQDSAADMTYHAVLVSDHKLIAGGSKPIVFHYDFRGEEISQAPVNPTTVYSLAASNQRQHGSTTLVTCGGASSKVDVFTSIGYRSQILDTFPL